MLVPNIQFTVYSLQFRDVASLQTTNYKLQTFTRIGSSLCE